MLKAIGTTSVRYLGQLISAAAGLANLQLAPHQSVAVGALQIKQLLYT
jgi:hypothetical protein